MRKEIQRDHDLGDEIIQKLYEIGQEVKVWTVQLLCSRRHFWTDLCIPIKAKFDQELKSRQDSADRRLWMDKDLTRPYEETKRRAELCAQHDQNLLAEELRRIEEVVENIRVHEKRITAEFTRLPAVERQEILRDLSSRYVASLQDLHCIAFSEEEVMRVAASYCYVYDLREYNASHRFQNQGTRLAMLWHEGTR